MGGLWDAFLSHFVWPFLEDAPGGLGLKTHFHLFFLGPKALPSRKGQTLGTFFLANVLAWFMLQERIWGGG